MHNCMTFEIKFMNMLQKLNDERKMSELANLTDIEQSNLSRALKGQKLGIDKVSKILDVIGAKVFFPDDDYQESVSVMRRMGEHSPVEPVENEFTMPIPVYAEVGAGNDIEIVEPIPICTISILKSYYTDKHMYAALVGGDSMSPTIKKGAYIGIVPVCGALEDGAVYLVQRPYFGQMVKRVFLSPDARSIILHSDNPRWEDQIIALEECHTVIVGRVQWVMQTI